MPPPVHPFQPPFKEGRLVITRAAQKALCWDDILQALRVQEAGIGRCLPGAQRREQARRLLQGVRLLTAYKDHKGCPFWILTEADRSVIKVLLPYEF